MNKILRFFFVFSLIYVLILCGCGTATTQWAQLYQTESDDESAIEPQNAEDSSNDTTEEETEGTQEKNKEAKDITATVCVYICGAVANPGVYELPEGSRVIQVIEAAGGLSADADMLLVNQARIVEDGEQIRIYTKEEALGADLQIQTDGGKTADSKININTADIDDLMTLPGIGEAKAEAIIEYRDAQGSFQTIEDIMNIPGIKEAVFSKIKDKITV